MKEHFLKFIAMRNIFLFIVCAVFGVSAYCQPVANTIAIEPGDSPEVIVEKATRVVPTANQYAALKNEFIAFIHFGPNSFTRMEWGTGKEDPAIFDLKELDTDQWCKAMKASGMKMVIITAKHHDGFVIWQSRYTKHGIMSTGFQNGKGDIVKSLAASCKKYGLKLGIYLSPADLFQIENSEGLYGNGSAQTKRTIPRAVPGRPFANKTRFTFEVDDYNEYFLNQLFELLTEYGPIDEVWFDGAHPKRKGNQQYNYTAWKQVIHTLAPRAVIFGKEDIRWCGNESGRTRETEWNVIPYQEDPRTAQHFPDLEANSLGSREDLYKGKFLHYQPAETNTSIREGWFYRDDSLQKVRNADDVFDIYERAVGGNSIFLLNIPPNRNGRFSGEDVAVLTETGRRIRQTYGNDLFGKAKRKTVSPQEILIETAMPVAINRLLLQEDVLHSSERVEKHAVDAWVNNEWKEIAAATNIGYKRIIRFPTVTASRFRVRLLETRAKPTIIKVGGYYYQAQPPALSIQRNKEGLISIQPAVHAFGWKPYGVDATKNLLSGVRIYYTVDGSAPNRQSPVYTAPFFSAQPVIKAFAFVNDKAGPVAAASFGILSKNWKVVKTDSEADKHAALAAIDGDPASYWQSAVGDTHFIELDLGQAETLAGFSYTPQTNNHDGMLEKGSISFSNDGQQWTASEQFSFGNLINDPTERRFHFKKPVNTRFVRIQSTVIAGGSNTLSIAELGFFQ